MTDIDEAQARVAEALVGIVDSTVAADQLDRCTYELRRMGLRQPGLVVAAEHMAIARLRVATAARSRCAGIPTQHSRTGPVPDSQRTTPEAETS